MIKSPNTQVLFRCDASNTLGAGHVLRCITLANQLKAYKAECTFVCREAPGHLMDVIKKHGHKVVALPEKVSVEEDIQLTKNYIQSTGYHMDWLIVDHAFLDVKWEERVRLLANNTFVIDDAANRKHSCDLLLDANMAPDMTHRYQELLPGNASQILGPKYALLREEFIQARKHVSMRNFPPKHVLVNFGGGDPKGLVLKSLKALNYAGYADMLTVVAGPQNRDTAEIEAMCAKRPNTVFLNATENMAELMTKADIAIGASGSTTWERMCLGLPCITLAANPTQEMLTKFLVEEQLAYFAGNVDELTTEKFAEVIEKAFSDERKFRLIEKYAKQAVDGKGAHYVAEILLGE